MKNLLLLSAMFFSTSALAVSVGTTPTIVGYNINNAAISGTGGWVHDYTGTIIDLGGGLANYEGGTGTLADSVIGNSVFSTQLFRTPDATSITVFLDDFYELTSVTLFGGPESDAIPGQLTEVTFVFPTLDLGFTETGIPFGELNIDLTPINDEFSFEYVTPPVNQFTMTNFSGNWNDYYSISEIQVSAVPEPSTYALMLGGLGLVGFMAARRRRHSA